jgi:hypothetical protein
MRAQEILGEISQNSQHTLYIQNIMSSMVGKVQSLDCLADKTTASRYANSLKGCAHA